MIAKNATLAADTSIQTEIFYPETDDIPPTPDGYYQSKHTRDLITMLALFFAQRNDVVVSGDIFIYYDKYNPHGRNAPSCFVVIGISEESFLRNNAYLVWDVGKWPDFVLEIGSPTTAMDDLGWKRDVYASRGVGEYWMFDPSGGDHYGFALRGERLVDGEYRLVEMREDADGGVWGHSPTLSLEFHWEDGSLRLYDPVGERWLQTSSELEAARVTAESRAESAESRVAELEAELRRLRGQG